MYLKVALNWEPTIAISPAHIGRILVAITFGLSFNASISAQETVTAPTPAIVTTAPVESTAPPAPPATTTEANSLSDAEILERLPKLPTAQLQNLLSVYARLKNDRMSNSIMAELNRRAPGSITAGMTQSMRNEALGIDNEPPNPYEVEETQIDILTTRKQYAEAIAKMEQMRSQKLGGQYFPFEVELGDAYGSTGKFVEARAAYFRALNQTNASTTQKSLAQAGLVEIEKLEATKAAYDLIKARKPKEALAQAEALKAKYPQDVEIQLLYAQALVPNYRYSEALPLLESIKIRHFSGKPFPALDALAESLRAMGRFDESKAAYEIFLLSNDPEILEHHRTEAIVAAREVSRERAATIQGSAEFLQEAEGDARFYRLHASAPIAPKLHAGIDAWNYGTSLSSERSIRQSSGDYTGADAFLRRYLDDRFTYVEARVGGATHDEVSAGFTFGKERAHEGAIGYDLSIDLNSPTIDSLQLIALNGNEDRISGNVTVPLPAKFELSAGAMARRIQVNGVDLGNGWNSYLEVNRPVWKNTQDTASFTVGYRADYERFNASNVSDREANRLGFEGGGLIGADLLQPRYHPHGFQAVYENRLNKDFFTFVGAGLLYDFAEEEWDYNFTAGMEYTLTDTLDLLVEGGYYSDGTGANNSGEAVLVGNVGVRSFF